LGRIWFGCKRYEDTQGKKQERTDLCVKGKWEMLDLCCLVALNCCAYLKTEVTTTVVTTIKLRK
jgi:hypothetical protein